MSISILVQPIPSGFRADTGSPLELSAEGRTSEDAIQALQSKIAERLVHGAKLVELPIAFHKYDGTPNLAEHCIYEDFLAACQEYRRVQEATEESATN